MSTTVDSAAETQVSPIMPRASALYPGHALFKLKVLRTRPPHRSPPSPHTAQQEWPLGAPDLVAPSTPTKSHLHPRSGPHEHKIAAIVEGSRRAVGQQRPSQALPRADFRLQRETGMHTLAFEAAPGGSDTIQLTRDSARRHSQDRAHTTRH